MRYDSVVIGSGVSGLTTALVLAQNGQRVALIEKNSSIAPLIRRFRRSNFWCDPGFHYSGGFEESGTMSVMFRYLRMRDRIQSVPMNENGYDVFRVGDREIRFPVGINNVQTSLSESFPGSRLAIDEYIKKIRYITESTAFLNFGPSYSEVPTDPAVNESLDVFLRQRGAEDSLVRLLGMYGQSLYGSPAQEIPFSLHAMVMGTFYRSPQTLVRGGDEIVDAFSSRLREEGVDVLCSKAAAAIEVGEGRQLKGVRTSDGEMLECRHCVSTMHPARILEILPREAIRPAYTSRIQRLVNTKPAFALFLQTDVVPAGLSGSNYYSLPENGTDSLSVMGCGPNTDAQNKKALCLLLEEGDEVRSGMKWRSEKYREYKASQAENATARMVDLFPELKGKCRVVDTATGFTYERYTGTPGGSMYGVKQSIDQIQLSQATPVKGLYLAGQSILIPGVMSSMISGLLAALYILDAKTIWNEIIKCR